ncbi:MAG TPA: type VI secretion system tip protein TssI/VgrG, partial [Fimbriiglobus sp.]|nr:type VI secretion system tip protein TssI/VgrG [Fimbriiglobus sp.]
MPKYSQAGRLLAVTTPLGPDALLLARFAGTEALSELFEFRLDLLAERDTDVPFDKLLGQSATVALKRPDGSYRHFNGIVNRVSQGEMVSGPYGGQTFVRYAATVAPQVWLLTCKAQSRIFQQVNVPDILKQVFAGFDVDWQVQGTFHPRDYCVQYRETDWAFASRIMEEEGIYYFFKHSDGAHKLVVANTPAGHPDVPAPTAAVYETIAGGRPPDDRVHYWAKTQEVRSGKYTLWDHCFELPGQHLDATKTIQETVTVGTVDHKLKVGGNDKLELYDYPGAYAQRFDGVAPGGGDRKSDVQKIFEDNSRTVGIRMQQEAAPGLTIAGSSGCRQLAAGHKFSLQRHFNADGEYLLTRVSHSADAAAEYTQANGPEPAYQNSFTCIPAGLPFRPPQATPKARVAGTHTATVVGPPGEEIFTDKYSRVKVQFHWDRQGKNDADSSCWVRVATLWAGKQWGMIHIPRIGQEVVVDFLEGDPDQPIIVGSVYNAEQMPPYALPDHRTQSGLKTRSSLKGTEANFNELRFEDKKGAEQVYFHAERNFDRVVENDDTISVGFEDHDPG